MKSQVNMFAQPFNLIQPSCFGHSVVPSSASILSRSPVTRVVGSRFAGRFCRATSNVEEFGGSRHLQGPLYFVKRKVLGVRGKWYPKQSMSFGVNVCIICIFHINIHGVYGYGMVPWYGMRSTSDPYSVTYSFAKVEEASPFVVESCCLVVRVSSNKNVQHTSCSLAWSPRTNRTPRQEMSNIG